MIEKCSITKLLLLFRGDENGLMQYRTAGSVLPLLPPARVADRHSCKYIFLDFGLCNSAPAGGWQCCPTPRRKRCPRRPIRWTMSTAK